MTTAGTTVCLSLYVSSKPFCFFVRLSHIMYVW